ncbi:uncharacterized protein LOC142345498 isoform X2 [Convolutriloba macropyga]|uniref:uncharacterized protein LOC142345498 isoform X2 n=1 Tax=Convolutriloba macropyga TaxID=536237 RepID=UPI003F5207ED
MVNLREILKLQPIIIQCSQTSLLREGLIDCKTEFSSSDLKLQSAMNVVCLFVGFWAAAVLLNECTCKCVIGTFEIPGVKDSCFYASTEALTMQAAREQCKRWKGRLYERSSYDELQKMTTVLQNMSPKAPTWPNKSSQKATCTVPLAIKEI